MLNADRSSTTRNKIVAGRAISKVSRTNPSKGDRVFSSQEQTLYRIIGDLADTDKTLQGIVTYEGTGSDGGKPPKVQKVYASTFIPEKNNELVKSEHRLIGWSTNPGSSISMYTPGQRYKTVETLTLHPVWTRGYMIKYNANAPSGSLSGVVPVDTYPYLLNDSVMPLEYTGQFTYLRNAFSEWNLNDNGQGMSISDKEPFTLTSDMISENSYDIVLYAIWEASFIVTYVVTNVAGTELSRTQFPTKYIYKGIHVAKVAEQEPANGRFDKWSVEDGISERFFDPEGEVTIYGNTMITTKWVPTFRVYYYSNPPLGKTVTGALPVDDVKHDKDSDVNILNRGDNPIEIYKYRFLGWNESSSASSGQTFEDNQFKSIQSDKHLYAIWEETHTVTYYGQGHEVGVLPVEPIQNTYAYPYPKGSPVIVTSPEVFKKYKYHFLGWNEDEDADTAQTFENNIIENIQSDITLYAIWEETHTVTYYGQGNTSGEIPDDSMPVRDTYPYRKGTTVNIIIPREEDEFKKEGYRFLGWNEDEDAGIAQTFLDNKLSNIQSDIHLYAIWKKQYTITYSAPDMTGGAIPNPISYDIDQDIAITSLVPSRPDYDFGGWSRRGSNPLVTYQKGDTARDKILSADFTTDITLDAIWIELVGIIYNSNGNVDTTGNVPATKYYQVGTANVPVEDNIGVPTLVKKGHTFEGWNSSTAYTSTSEYKYPNTFPIVEKGTGLNVDIQLYANWSRKTYNIIYTTIDSTSGNPTVSSESYLYGDVITYINTRGSLYKQGNLFTRWTDRVTGLFYKEGAITLSAQGLTMSDSDIILDPVWIVEYYSVTYHNGGGSGVLPTGVTKELSTYIYGASVPVSANPTGEGISELNKRGHTFLGWKVNDTGDTLVYRQTFSITIDSILYAQWSRDPYRLYYRNSVRGTTGEQTDSNLYYIYAYYPDSFALVKNKGTLDSTTATFKEWYTNNNGTGGTPYSLNDEIRFDNVDRELFAIWLCTITYKSNGDDASTTDIIDNEIHSDNNGVITLRTPVYTKTGNTLKGWYTIVNGNKIYYSSTGYPYTFTLIKHTTFYARWTCTVTYNNLDSTGNAPNISEYENGTTFNLPDKNTLQRTNYTFAGWYTNINNIQTYYPVGYSFTITSDTTFYPIWACSVSYDVNGGNTGQTMPVDEGTQMVNRYVTDATDDQKNTGLGLYLPGDTVTVLANDLSKANNTADGWWYRTTPTGSKNYVKSPNTFYIYTNTTLYAKWMCRLTYSYVRSGVTTTTVYDIENGTLVTPDDFSVPYYGYTLDGWYVNDVEQSSFSISVNITLYARWTANIYTITYRGGDGTVGDPFYFEGTYEITPAMFIEPNILSTGKRFSKDGENYRLIKWTTTNPINNVTTEYDVNDNVTKIAFDRNVDLYGVWVPTYRVLYNINLNVYTGVSIYYSNYGIFGETPAALADGSPSYSFSPSLTSVTTHTFKEWYSNNTGVGGTSYATRPSITINDSNVNIYAIWTCRITYMNEDSVAYTSSEFIHQTQQTLGSGASLSKTGNTFNGWYYLPSSTSIIEYTPASTIMDGDVYNENGFTVTKYPFTKQITMSSNITLYAKWVCNAIFNGNTETSGIFPDQITVTNNNGRNVVIIPGNTGNLQRTNSELDVNVWYYMSGTTKNEVKNNDSVTIHTDTTFYANWKYRVTYVSSGFTETSSLYRIHEGFTVSNSTPILENFTFGGWKSSDTSNTYSSGTTYPTGTDVAPSQNITLTAVWQSNYTVTFNYGDGSDPVTISQTFAISPIQNYTNTDAPPTRAGYTFAGWLVNLSTVPIMNINSIPINQITTFTAQWTIHTYTVRYLVGVELATGSPTLPSDSQVNYNSVFTVSNRGLFYNDSTQLKRVTSWYYTISSGVSVSTFDSTSVSTLVGTNFVSNVPALSTTGLTLTLYPIWETAFTVTYTNGINSIYPSILPQGSVTDPNSPYVIGSTVTSLTLLQSSGVTLKGHTLTGWKLDPDGSNYVFDVEQYSLPIYSNITFSAVWTVKTIQITYNPRGNNIAGNFTSANSRPYGSQLEITTSPTPMRGTTPLGQTIVVTGWSYGETGRPTEETIYKSNDKYIVTLDDYPTTIYTTWTNTYAIEYDLNSITLNTGMSLPSIVLDGNTEINVLGNLFTQGTTYTVPTTTLIGKNSSNVFNKSITFKYYTTGTTPDYTTISNNSFTMPGNKITIVPDWFIVYSVVYDLDGYYLSEGSSLPTTINTLTSIAIPNYFTASTALTIPPTTLIGTDSSNVSYKSTKFKYYTTEATSVSIINNSFSMPENNITIVPDWKRLYTINYSLDDGYTLTTGTLPSTIIEGTESPVNTPNVFISTTSLTIPPTTSLIGTLNNVYYKATNFKYKLENGTYTSISNTFSMPANNITIVPDWQPYQFTLQFSYDGKITTGFPTTITVASEIKNVPISTPLNVVFNSSIVIPTINLIGTASGASYTATSFKYYITGASPRVDYTLSNTFTMPENNITIFPDWTLVYKITYVASDFLPLAGYPSIPVVSYVLPNTTHTISDTKYVGTVSSINKIITSWTITGTGINNLHNVFTTPSDGITTKSSYDITNITSDITITASTTNAFSASYYNGINLLATKYYFYVVATPEFFAQETTQLTATTPAGQFFYGWGTGNNASDYTISTGNTRISTNTIYYLKWGYPLTFNAGDGTGISYIESIIPGSTYDFFNTAIPLFTYPNKSFAGWSLSQNGARLYNRSITSALDVYARWGDLSITYKTSFPAFQLTFNDISEKTYWYTENEPFTILPLTDTTARRTLATPEFAYSKPSTTESINAQRVFLGWSTIESTTENLDSNNRTSFGTMAATYIKDTTYTITSSIELYMCWAPKCTYTIYSTAASGTGGTGTAGTVTSITIDQYYGYNINFSDYIDSFMNGSLVVSGWAIKTAATATTIVDLDAEASQTMEATSINVYPYYNFPVTYNINGGTVAIGYSLPIKRGYRTSFTVNKMTGLMIHPNGLIFKGWLTSLSTPVFYSSDTGTSDDIITPSAALTLYAAYGGTTTYNYNLNSGSGTLSGHTYVYYKGCTPIAATITNSLYNGINLFLQWNTVIDESVGYSSGGQIPTIDTISNVDATINLYAIWGTSITYIKGSQGSWPTGSSTGSIAGSPQRFVIGYSVPFEKPSNITPPTSKNFVGWNSLENQVTNSFTEASITETSMTVYPAWTTATVYGLTYKTYDDTATNVPSESRKMYQNQIIKFKGNPTPAMVNPTNWPTLSGWRLILNGSKASGAAATLNENNARFYAVGDRYTVTAIITAQSNAYAAWGPKATISFHKGEGGGNSPPSIDFYFNDSVTLPDPDITSMTPPAGAGRFYKWNAYTSSSYITGPSYAALTSIVTSGTGYPVNSGATPTLYATYGFGIQYYTYDNSTTGVPTDNDGYYTGKQITLMGNTNMSSPAGFGTFAGWRIVYGTAVSTAKPSPFNDITAPFQSTTFNLGTVVNTISAYAAWGPAFIYYYNGDTLFDTTNYYYNDALVLKSGPSGSLPFFKWNTNNSETGTYYASGDTTYPVPTTEGTSISLYATFGYGIQYYTYNDLTTNVPTDNNVYYTGKQMTLQVNTTAAPNDSFNTFVGWRLVYAESKPSLFNNDTVPLKTTTPFILDTVTHTLKAYATWGPPVTITFHAGNGTGPTGIDRPTRSGYYNDTITLPTTSGFTTDVSSYDFLGWNTSPDGTGNSYAAGSNYTITTITTDLYARWGNFTIRYDPNTPTTSSIIVIVNNVDTTVSSGTISGSVPTTPFAYRIGVNYKVLANLNDLTTSGNYTVSKWYIMNSGVRTYYDFESEFTMPAYNVTFFAEWVAASLRVTYAQSSQYGINRMTLPTDPKKYYLGQKCYIAKTNWPSVGGTYAIRQWTWTDPTGTTSPIVRFSNRGESFFMPSTSVAFTNVDIQSDNIALFYYNNNSVITPSYPQGLSAYYNNESETISVRPKPNPPVTGLMLNGWIYTGTSSAELLSSIPPSTTAPTSNTLTVGYLYNNSTAFTPTLINNNTGHYLHAAWGPTATSGFSVTYSLSEGDSEPAGENLSDTNVYYYGMKCNIKYTSLTRTNLVLGWSHGTNKYSKSPSASQFTSFTINNNTTLTSIWGVSVSFNIVGWNSPTTSQTTELNAVSNTIYYPGDDITIPTTVLTKTTSGTSYNLWGWSYTNDSEVTTYIAVSTDTTQKIRVTSNTRNLTLTAVQAITVTYSGVITYGTLPTDTPKRVGETFSIKDLVNPLTVQSTTALRFVGWYVGTAYNVTGATSTSAPTSDNHYAVGETYVAQSTNVTFNLQTATPITLYNISDSGTNSQILPNPIPTSREFEIPYTDYEGNSISVPSDVPTGWTVPSGWGTFVGWRWGGYNSTIATTSFTALNLPIFPAGATRYLTYAAPSNRGASMYVVWGPAATISFHAGEGSGNPPSTITYYYRDGTTLPDKGSMTPPITSPVSAAGEPPFYRWNTYANNSYTSGIKHATGAAILSTGTGYVVSSGTSYTLRATWGYGVTYNSNGGSSTPTDNDGYYTGKTINFPTVTRTDEIAFSGWRLNSLTAPPQTGNSFVLPTISADITFIAAWGSPLTVTFSAGYGSGTASTTSSSAYYNEDITLPSNSNGFSAPSRAPSAPFLGWWPNQNGTGSGYAAGAIYTITTTTTLYAIWGTDITYYTVTGQQITGNPYRYVIGYSVPLAQPSGVSAPSGRPNFAGWNSVSGNSVNNFIEANISTVTINLFAAWSTSTFYGLTYNKIPSSSSGNVPSEPRKMYQNQIIKFAGNTETPAMASPNANNWPTFAGWRLVVNGSNPTAGFNDSDTVHNPNSLYKVNTTTTSMSNAYAAWGPSVITYYNGSTIVGTTNYYYNDSLTLKSVEGMTSTVTGVTVYQWSTDSTPTTSSTYYAPGSTTYPFPTSETGASLYAIWGYEIKYHKGSGSGNTYSEVSGNTGTYTLLPELPDSIDSPNDAPPFVGWTSGNVTGTSGTSRIITTYPITNGTNEVSALWGYSLTCNPGTGSGSPYKVYYSTTSVTSATLPTNTFTYTSTPTLSFAGWFTSSSVTSGETLLSSTTLSDTPANNNVYAIWGYSLTYNPGTNGIGTAYKVYYSTNSADLPEGTTFTNTTTPSFAGWFTSSTATNGSTTLLSSPLTLLTSPSSNNVFAIWGYSLTYNPGTGGGSPSKIYYSNSTVNLWSATSRPSAFSAPTSGFSTFVGWGTTNSNNQIISTTTYTITPTTNQVYAKWGYVITYDRGNGATTTQIKVAYSSSPVTLPLISTFPTFTGSSTQTFAGWATTNSDTTIINIATHPISANIILYARWRTGPFVSYGSYQGTDDKFINVLTNPTVPTDPTFMDPAPTYTSTGGRVPDRGVYTVGSPYTLVLNTLAVNIDYMITKWFYITTSGSRIEYDVNQTISSMPSVTNTATNTLELRAKWTAVTENDYYTVSYDKGTFNIRQLNDNVYTLPTKLRYPRNIQIPVHNFPIKQLNTNYRTITYTSSIDGNTYNVGDFFTLTTNVTFTISSMQA
jgi:uncharacterized repeat protein (TIGR02543 family)